MDLFGNSSLGGDSNLHCQQSCPLAKHQTCISSSCLIQKKLQGSTYRHKSAKATRSSWNTTRNSLDHFFLWSHNKQWPLNNGKEYQYHPVSSTRSFHVFALAKHTLTCAPFRQTLQAKHHLRQWTIQSNPKVQFRIEGNIFRGLLTL